MSVITTVEQLQALYGLPGETSLVKELDHVIPEYAAFIEASPFVALATSGPEGLDCSPRGDLAGFVRIHDPKTLMMPDRPEVAAVTRKNPGNHHPKRHRRRGLRQRMARAREKVDVVSGSPASPVTLP